jgi:hypothetical protein
VIARSERFCMVTPEEVACIDVLEHSCSLPHPAPSHPNPSTCVACVRKHASDIRKANCTRSWEQEYCHPAPAPAPPAADKSRRAQTAACTKEKQDPEACKQRISKNWDAMGAAGCGIADDESFYHVTPAEVVCMNAMEKACGKPHPDEETCRTCLKTHSTTVRAANCTDPWVEEYCDPN